MPLMSLKEAKVIAKGHAARRFEMTAPDAKAVKEETGLLQGDYAKLMRVAARKVAESRDLTVRVFARWIDETLFYRSPPTSRRSCAGSMPTSTRRSATCSLRMRSQAMCWRSLGRAPTPQ